MPATVTADPLVERLRALLGRDAVLANPSELIVYECDAFTVEKNRPEVVVFPTTTEQVAAIVRLCKETDTPFLAPYGTHAGSRGASVSPAWWGMRCR